MMCSRWIYQRLLALYPRKHREEYGELMAQLFRDQSREAWQSKRGWGLTLLWLRILPDLVKTSLWERLTNTKERESMFKKFVRGTQTRPALTLVFIAITFGVFFFVLSTATVVTFILPEAFRSVARIKVEHNSAGDVGGKSETGVFVYDPNFIQTEIEIIQSEKILDQVIERLDLRTHWQKKYTLASKLKTSECRSLLRRMVKLSSVRNTSLIDIRVDSDDRFEATAIANTIAEVFVDYRKDESTAKYKEVREQIRNFLAAKGNEAKMDDAKVTEVLAQLKQYEQYASPAGAPAKVEIIEHAEPSNRPIRPNKPLNIFLGSLLGGILGLVAGTVAVVILVKLNRKAAPASLSPA